MTEKKYLHFLIYMLVTMAFLPVVYLNFPAGVRSLRFFWGPLWLISIFILNFKVYYQKTVILIILFTIVTSFVLPNTLWHNRENLYVDYDFNKSVFYESYLMLLALTVFYYLYLTKDYLFWSKLTKLMIFYLFLTSVLTIVSVYFNPTYARELTNAKLGFSQLSEGSFMRRLGGATYGYLQTFVIVIPSLVYIMKYGVNINKRYKVYLFVLTVLLFISIVLTQFFANILVASIFVIFSIQGGKNLKRSLYYVITVLLIALLLPAEFYLYIIDSLGGLFSRSTENYYKLDEFSSYIEFGGGYSNSNAIGSRMERYPLLLEAFSRSPLLGNSFSNNPLFIQFGSQHLFFMGRLAEFGIFVFFIYYLVYYRIIKFQVNLFKNTNYLYFYLLAISSFIILGLMKVIAGMTMWFSLFVYIPGVYFYAMTNTKRKS